MQAAFEYPNRWIMDRFLNMIQGIQIRNQLVRFADYDFIIVIMYKTRSNHRVYTLGVITHIIISANSLTISVVIRVKISKSNILLLYT